MATKLEDVISEYKALVNGIEPSADDAISFVFLVASTDYEHPRGDLFVGAGLARGLVTRGHGAKLVGPEGWYRPQDPGSVVVVMTADTDVRRVPAGQVTVAWIRNRTDDWIARPGGLELYDGVFTSSELSRRAVEKVYSGPTGVCRIGFDPDLFFEDGRERTVTAATTANHWGTDRAVHSAIRTLVRDGFSVDWYGVDKSGDPILATVSKGPVSFFDVPDVYRHSILTIDDLQDVAVGYGNLNSRVFEALACGSLVVTNSALGLAEAGLDGVPVYHSIEDLDHIAESAASGELDTVAKDLRDRVVKDHTFSVRAETFEALVNMAVSVHERRQERPVLNFFPDYSSTNPYQSLLYEEASRTAVVVPVADIFNNQVARGRSDASLEGHTLHLHWLNGIVQPGANVQEAIYRLDRFKNEILFLKDRGVRIVWTVHNVLPHELTYRFLEIELSEFIAEQADVIHVMSRETVAAAADYYQLPDHKVVEVEHPSFEGCYPLLLDRQHARERLSLRNGDISFLFFGAIRHYKGIPRLLDAFEVASEQDARLRLDIAGGVARTMYAEVVDRMKKANRVFPHIGFVPDDHVQRYLAAADVMVLPYENILNSGALLLATTFGLPVVVPRIGQLAELDDSGFVEFFEAGSTLSLSNALERAAESLACADARECAYEYARSREPASVSAKFATTVLGY